MTQTPNFDRVVLFFPSDDRRLTRTGIQVHRLQYWTEQLRPYIHQKLKLKIYWDPRSIRVIYIRLPIGVVVRADITTPDIPDISLTEWMARRRAEHAVCNTPALVETRAQSQRRRDNIVEQAKATLSVKRRSATKAAGDKHAPLPAKTPEEVLSGPAMKSTISTTRVAYSIEGTL